MQHAQTVDQRLGDMTLKYSITGIRGPYADAHWGISTCRYPAIPLAPLPDKCPPGGQLSGVLDHRTTLFPFDLPFG